MKKSLILVVSFVMLCIIVFSGCEFYVFGQNDNSNNSNNNNSSDNTFSSSYEYSVWIPTVWGLAFPKNPTTNDASLRAELDAIVENSLANNIKNIFFQVRPSSDALYKSEIFPWSRWLTGQQGVAPDNGFDPLAYIIEKSHEVGIKLHAWINPFRITIAASDVLVPNHPAVANPAIFFESNNRLFLDPGHPCARLLILDGVQEIIENYNVDGIHYDDYFYPEIGNIPDLLTFITHGQTHPNVTAWRISNVTTLIADTHRLIKTLRPNVEFGVSPPGIWANRSSNTHGSNTNGWESLTAIYADSRNWVVSGFVDYIAPQIYWHIGQPGADFRVVLQWWHDLCKEHNTKLIVGIGAYKAEVASFGNAWLNEDELSLQLALAIAYSDGLAIYDYRDLDKHQMQRAFRFIETIHEKLNS